MSSAAVTVTAKAGPAIQATTLAIQNVTLLTFDFGKEVVTMFVGGSVEREFDFTSVGTITFTVSAAGGNGTITLAA